MGEFERFIAQDAPTRETINAFLKERTFPLVEDGQATFVFHGQADEVHLRHFIYGLPSSQPLRRVEGTDLWHLTIDLPGSSRIEYKIERVKGEEREWLMDPLNPNVARDPYGANSVCHGDEYETPEWILQGYEWETLPLMDEIHEEFNKEFGTEFQFALQPKDDPAN